MIAARGPGKTAESSGEDTSSAPSFWDVGCWLWDAAVLASVLAEHPARHGVCGAGGT